MNISCNLVILRLVKLIITFSFGRGQINYNLKLLPPFISKTLAGFEVSEAFTVGTMPDLNKLKNY